MKLKTLVRLSTLGMALTFIGCASQSADESYSRVTGWKYNDEKGTGLGLPSAYSTVLAHEGGIRVESRLRVGTSFIIHIPLLSTPRDEA